MTSLRLALALAAMTIATENSAVADPPLGLTPWKPTTLKIAGEYAGDGRRAEPAPVLGFDTGKIQDEYLVFIKPARGAHEKSVQSELPIADLPKTLPSD